MSKILYLDIAYLSRNWIHNIEHKSVSYLYGTKTWMFYPGILLHTYLRRVNTSSSRDNFIKRQSVCLKRNNIFHYNRYIPHRKFFKFSKVSCVRPTETTPFLQIYNQNLFRLRKRKRRFSFLWRSCPTSGLGRLVVDVSSSRTIRHAYIR